MCIFHDIGILRTKMGKNAINADVSSFELICIKNNLHYLKEI